MALKKIKNDLWFCEDLFGDVSQLIRVEKVLFKKTTRGDNGEKLQELLILKTHRFGKMLSLDGIVQLTQADEKYYHEPFAHCALFFHPNPKKILIIGGGDGALLRETRKHSVEAITLVDIDKDVIELTKKYIPEIAGNSWEDKRLKIFTEDGAKFVKNTKEKYDIIFLDTPDPIGPAKSLFQDDFYRDCSKIISNGGIIMRQTGSSVFQPEEMPINFRQMENFFGKATVFLTAVPTYIGGYFTFVAASKRKNIFKKSLKEIEKKFKKTKLETKWYTPEMHLASMALPGEIKQKIE